MVTIWTPALDNYAGPRYKALAAAIADAVQNGELEIGGKLPPQRRLADALCVTIGTVTRAYAEAERLGIVEARVGSGTYVSEQDSSTIFKEEETDSSLIDLSLSKMPRVAREPFLAKSLHAIQHDPVRLNRCLSYQLQAGNPYHRSVFSQWLSKNKLPSNPEQMVLTQGGLHALSIALHALCKPGDVVLAEGLSYPGFIEAAKQQSLKTVPVAFDNEGMLPDALVSTLKQTNARAMYLMPSMHNPAATCMPLERRQAIVNIALQHKLLIIEDEVPYIPVAKRIATMSSMAPDIVLSISSFSKILAGGFRIGCIVAPPHLFAKVEHALRANCWMATALSAEVVCHWIESGAADAVINLQHKSILERQALLNKYLADFHYTSQAHAVHAWLHLPETWKAWQFIETLRKLNILVIGCETFSVGRYLCQPGVRICIGEASINQLETALKMIRSTLNSPPENYQQIM